jgi:hypothetical protein
MAAVAPVDYVTSRGTYTVYEQLGVGGMATVHRADRRDGGARQRVALKRLLPSAAADPQLVQLFLHEAKIAACLHHRNIAQIYESGQFDDECFIAMEYVAGPTLNHLLKCCRETVGQVPFPIVIKILSEVCDALAYAHACTDAKGKALGLVHRDVSPSNIVISSNGVVKLIDFGVAKTVTSQTQAGIIKGKLGYVAPEYLEGQIDARADLWAVGVCAWEMLTGQRLFKTDDDFSTLQAVRSQPVDPPSVHNPDVPPELDAIVMTALHRTPRERWQNAEALRTALLGVAPASSNADLVEWVEWVMKLAERGLRPPRGSRPLGMNAAKAQAIMLPVAAKTVAIAPLPATPLPPSAPTIVALVPKVDAAAPMPPRPPSATPRPSTQMPTPPSGALRERRKRAGTIRGPVSQMLAVNSAPEARKPAADPATTLFKRETEPSTDPFARPTSSGDASPPFEGKTDPFASNDPFAANDEFVPNQLLHTGAREPAPAFRVVSHAAPPAMGILRAPSPADSRERATVVAAGRLARSSTPMPAAPRATAFSSANPSARPTRKPMAPPDTVRLSTAQITVGLMLSLMAAMTVVAAMLWL